MGLLSSAVILCLACLFAGGAMHKLRLPADYQSLLSTYLGDRLATRGCLLAVAGLEMAVALLLLSPRSRLEATVTGSLLLLTYAVAMGWQYWRGENDLHCGCSGAGASLRVGPGVITRNLVVAALALASLCWQARFPVNVFEGVVVLIAAGTMAMLYRLAELMIAHHQAMDEDI